jgi:hypothetical protein
VLKTLLDRCARFSITLRTIKDWSSDGEGGPSPDVTASGPPEVDLRILRTIVPTVNPPQPRQWKSPSTASAGANGEIIVEGLNRFVGLDTQQSCIYGKAQEGLIWEKLLYPRSVSSPLFCPGSATSACSLPQ